MGVCYATSIMRRLNFYLGLLGWFCLLSQSATAVSLHLADGTVVNGEPVSFNEQGLVVRLDAGGYSDRIAWSKFTQETLKELVKIPKAASYAEPFVEVPLEVKQKAKQKEIVIKPVPNKVDRPTERIGLFAAFTTPAGLLILVILLVANLYAAYEIALYRNQPAGLVCAVSVFAPVLGPLLFLGLPSRLAPAVVEHAPPLPSEQIAESSMASAPQLAHGLSIAAAGKAAAPGQAPATIYRRGEHTFNRRFFETQMPGFFRMIPGEAEKDLVVVVKAIRGEYVAKRITRITGNEMYLQLQKSGASAEVMVPFAEITEVQVRHKDAKG
jgi:hypothetical protein